MQCSNGQGLYDIMKGRWINTDVAGEEEPMEMENEQIRVDKGSTDVVLYESKSKLRISGETEPLTRVLHEHLPLVEHREAEARAEAIMRIDANLGLTTRLETRTKILNTLEHQLWVEEDPSLVQKLVRVIGSLAILPADTPPPQSLFPNTLESCACCTFGQTIGRSEILCESCGKDGSLQVRDGAVSSNTSPQILRSVSRALEPHKALDMERKEGDLFHELYRFTDFESDGKLVSYLELDKSVAWLLQEYLSKKDCIGTGVKTAVRLQVLQSLVRIGEMTKGVVTWDSLRHAIKEQLGSKNPRVRALVLRLLGASIQERERASNNETVVRSNDARQENSSDSKRMRVGEADTISSPAASALNTGQKWKVGDPHISYLLEMSRPEGEKQNATGKFSGREGTVARAFDSFHLMGALLEYTRDPYPAVREMAVRALLKLQAKGYEMKSDCYRHAIDLFRDCFEPVRIAAVQLVGAWIKTLQDVEDGTQKPVNDAFLQVCTLVTDMSMRVREEAFRVLGGAARVGESILLQTLTKKVVGTVAKEKDIPASASIATPDGDTDLSKFEEGTSLLDASAAGAFVHGLEDEFSEVRSVAMEALANLACTCENMVPGAVDLLLDMLNDEVVVRLQAMQALSQVAMAGHMTVHDNHLHMFLSVLEDTNIEMRHGGRNLLASSHLPSFATFRSTVRALLTSLEHHPEDEGGVICTFSQLGQVHPTYAECIAHELLKEIRGSLRGDFGLDEPRCAAILSLFLAAGTLNSTMISLIPANFLAYASLIRHKLPSSLPLLKIWPIGFKTMQFAWSNRETPTPLQEPRKIRAAGLTSEGKPEDQASLQSNTSIRYRSCNASGHATENASDSSVLIQNSGRLQSVKRHSGLSQLPFLSSEGDHIEATQTEERDVLKCITNALETAHCVDIFLKKKAFKTAIHMLSGCRRDLKRLQWRNANLGPVVRCSALYIRCLTLVAQIQESLCPGYHSLRTTSTEELGHKLDLIVKQVLSCFSNLTLQQCIIMLEFRALVCLLKLLDKNSVLIEPVPTCLNQLSSIVQKANVLLIEQRKPTLALNPHSLRPLREDADSKEENISSISLFLKTVQDELLSEKVKSISMQSAVQQLACSYWPASCIVDKAVKETWAEVKAPGTDFEDPLGFVPGLPLGIPLDIVVHDAPEGGNFWVQYRVESLPPHYRYVDLLDASQTGGELWWREAIVQVDELPPAAACALKLCVVLEIGEQPEERSVGRGPKLPVVPLCVEIKTHVVLNKEKGTKVSQLRR